MRTTMRLDDAPLPPGEGARGRGGPPGLGRRRRRAADGARCAGGASRALEELPTYGGSGTLRGVDLWSNVGGPPAAEPRSGAWDAAGGHVDPSAVLDEDPPLDAGD